MTCLHQLWMDSCRDVRVFLILVFVSHLTDAVLAQELSSPTQYHKIEPCHPNCNEDQFGNPFDIIPPISKGSRNSNPPKVKGDFFTSDLADPESKAVSVGTKDTYDIGSYSTICWIEYTISKTYLKENNRTELQKEYAISFETPANIPDRFADKNSDTNTLGLKNTKVSKSIPFETVSNNGETLVQEAKTVKCGAGPIYTRELVSWPSANKKKLVIRVSPKDDTVRIDCDNSASGGKSEPIELPSAPTTPRVSDNDGGFQPEGRFLDGDAAFSSEESTTPRISNLDSIIDAINGIVTESPEISVHRNKSELVKHVTQEVVTETIDEEIKDRLSDITTPLKNEPSNNDDLDTTPNPTDRVLPFSTDEPNITLDSEIKPRFLDLNNTEIVNPESNERETIDKAHLTTERSTEINDLLLTTSSDPNLRILTFEEPLSSEDPEYHLINETETPVENILKTTEVTEKNIELTTTPSVLKIRILDSETTETSVSLQTATETGITPDENIETSLDDESAYLENSSEMHSNDSCEASIEEQYDELDDYDQSDLPNITSQSNIILTSPPVPIQSTPVINNKLPGSIKGPSPISTELPRTNGNQAENDQFPNYRYDPNALDVTSLEDQSITPENADFISELTERFMHDTTDMPDHRQDLSTPSIATDNLQVDLINRLLDFDPERESALPNLQDDKKHVDTAPDEQAKYLNSMSTPYKIRTETTAPCDNKTNKPTERVFSIDKIKGEVEANLESTSPRSNVWTDDLERNLNEVLDDLPRNLKNINEKPSSEEIQLKDKITTNPVLDGNNNKEQSTPIMNFPENIKERIMPDLPEEISSDSFPTLNEINTPDYSISTSPVLHPSTPDVKSVFPLEISTIEPPNASIELRILDSIIDLSQPADETKEDSKRTDIPVPQIRNNAVINYDVITTPMPKINDEVAITERKMNPDENVPDQSTEINKVPFTTPTVTAIPNVRSTVMDNLEDALTITDVHPNRESAVTDGPLKIRIPLNEESFNSNPLGDPLSYITQPKITTKNPFTEIYQISTTKNPPDGYTEIKISNSTQGENSQENTFKYFTLNDLIYPPSATRSEMPSGLRDTTDSSSENPLPVTNNLYETTIPVHNIRTDATTKVLPMENPHGIPLNAENRMHNPSTAYGYYEITHPTEKPVTYYPYYIPTENMNQFTHIPKYTITTDGYYEPNQWTVPYTFYTDNVPVNGRMYSDPPNLHSSIVYPDYSTYPVYPLNTHFTNPEEHIFDYSVPLTTIHRNGFDNNFPPNPTPSIINRMQTSFPLLKDTNAPDTTTLVVQDQPELPPVARNMPPASITNALEENLLETKHLPQDTQKATTPMSPYYAAAKLTTPGQITSPAQHAIAILRDDLNIDCYDSYVNAHKIRCPDDLTHVPLYKHGYPTTKFATSSNEKPDLVRIENMGRLMRMLCTKKMRKYLDSPEQKNNPVRRYLRRNPRRSRPVARSFNSRAGPFKRTDKTRGRRNYSKKYEQ